MNLHYPQDITAIQFQSIALIGFVIILSPQKCNFTEIHPYFVIPLLDVDNHRRLLDGKHSSFLTFLTVHNETL